jgi:hypothetical protein
MAPHDDPYDIALALQTLEESKAKHGLTSGETYRAARALGQALSHDSTIDEELSLYLCLQKEIEDYQTRMPTSTSRSRIIHYTLAQGLAYHAKEMWFPCIELLEDGFARLSSLHVS